MSFPEGTSHLAGEVLDGQYHRDREHEDGQRVPDVAAEGVMVQVRTRLPAHRTPAILRYRPMVTAPALPVARQLLVAYCRMPRAKFRNSGTGAFIKGWSIAPRSNRLKLGFLINLQAWKSLKGGCDV